MGARHRRLVAVAAAAALAVTACGGSGHGTSGSPTSASSSGGTGSVGGSGGPAATGAAHDGGTLTVGIPGETNGWDPLTDEWSIQGYLVAENIFDPLVSTAAGPNGTRMLHPYLAQSITPDSTHQHWTITLRPGVRFSDGEALDASAVALQLNLAKTSLAGAVFGNNLIDHATAVDPTTVRVDLTQPDVAFEQILASQIGFIAAPRQLQGDPSSAASKPIGSGPFKLAEWVPDDHLKVVRNPNYWRPGLVHLDGILFKVIPDENTRAAAIRSGQIEFSYTATPSIIKQFQGSGGPIASMVVPSTGDPTFIALNTSKPPFNDVNLRRALSYATDVQQAISTIGLGVGHLATEPYPPGSKWYSPSGYPTAPDLNKARALIAQYKSAHGITGNVKVNLQCLAGDNQAMDLWKQQWSQIGVDATEQFVEYQTLVSNVISKNYQAACFALFGEGDPDLDAGFWYSNSAINFSGLNDPQIDHDIQVGRSAASADDPSRLAAYGDIWKQMADQVPYLWATFQPGMILYNSSIVHDLAGGTFPDGAAYPPLSDGVVPLVQVSVTH